MLFAGKTAAQDLGNSKALLQPSGTQYFHNQYLANPAMAGIDTGLHLNGAYRRQWDNIEGAPVTMHFSGDMALDKRIGIGLNVMDDEAGLLKRTRVAATYAYHLPVGSAGQKLHFGLSFVFNSQRLNYKDVNGDIADPSLSAFNRRDNYFEAEYGMAYTAGKWRVQAALPNIRSLVTGDDDMADGGGIFFSAVSYRFTPAGVVSAVEPKVCYRGVSGFKDILDVGVHVSFLDNVANITALYHSSKSFTGGVGVNIMKTVAIQALYTTQTGGIKTYMDGGYEIGATIHLFK